MVNILDVVKFMCFELINILYYYENVLKYILKKII